MPLSQIMHFSEGLIDKVGPAGKTGKDPLPRRFKNPAIDIQ